MGESPASISTHSPLASARKLVHISMLGFAFLLPYLSWLEAAGMALLALLFNLFILPHLAIDLRKSAGEGDATRVRTGIVLYPISVLALILLYRNEMHVGAAAWAIMALGDGAAGAVGERFGGPRLPFNPEKTWSGFAGFVVAGTVGAYVLARWVNPSLAPEKVAIISAAAALVGALVESLPIRLDDNASVPLVAGAFLYCAYLVERSALASNWPYLGRRMLLAVAINAALALVALALKMVTRSGAASGAVLGTAVYLGYAYRSFLVLLGFFVLGSIATRLGYAKKAARGIAERRGGARTWREATANSLAGGFFAVLSIATPHEGAFLLAMLAAFAEAAGDTVSSEIGQWLSPRAYLITTLNPVPAGENGGISLAGTLASFAASAAVVALGLALGLAGPSGPEALQSAAIALVAAFVGNLLDSVLGATIERRGLISNGIVNFVGTSVAGGLALAMAL